MNNSEVEDPNLTQFFEKYGIQTFVQDATEDETKVQEAIKIFVEQTGKPKNFMTFDQENEK